MWESFVALNCDNHDDFKTVGFPKDYLPKEIEQISGFRKTVDKDYIIDRCLNDEFQLPDTSDREGYYGQNHFAYWLSGLRDTKNIMSVCEDLEKEFDSILDMGCASGRVLRHLTSDNVRMVYGCDINNKHIRFVENFLKPTIRAFNNTSIPYISMPDSSVSVISAFSVFTHLESFVSAWIMEVLRVLEPGGIFFVTLHTEETLYSMKESWPVYDALRDHPKFSEAMSREVMKKERYVFRWHENRSYSSNVFYQTSYIKRTWGSKLSLIDIWRKFPEYQDTFIFQKK